MFFLKHLNRFFLNGTNEVFLKFGCEKSENSSKRFLFILYFDHKKGILHGNIWKLETN